MENLPTKYSEFDRRDFLKFQSLLMVWFYFLHGLRVDFFTSEQKVPDYSLLDKLLKLPFSDEVKNEVRLRVGIQKKYRYDANGELVGLDRFVKEIINFIVAKKDFRDFKLLNSIRDRQINHSYMFNATARHNTAKQMKYMQKRLLGFRNDEVLSNALYFAIKTKSFNTTLHILKQRIKLDDKVQNELINILKTQDYRHFYQQISQKQRNALPLIADKTHAHFKTTYRQANAYDFEDVLYSAVYNSLRVWFEKDVIDDFDIRIEKQHVHVKIWNYSNAYPIDFLSYLNQLLYQHGFGELSENFTFNAKENRICHISSLGNNEENKSIDVYEYLHVEVI